tara:strand:- start:4458 stop:4802 length:345 start_codon:yes stop_codon:yes gene_type:complete
MSFNNFTWNVNQTKQLKATRLGEHYRTINVLPIKNREVSVKQANTFVRKVIKKAMEKGTHEFQIAYYSKEYAFPFVSKWEDNFNEYENVDLTHYEPEDLQVYKIQINSIKKKKN